MNLKVRDVMKKDVARADSEATLFQISKMMWNNKFGSVVICDPKEESKAIGIVTWSNVIEAIAKKQAPSKVKAKDVIGKNLITATINESLLDVSRRMAVHKVDRLPVLDGDKLVGIVAEKDILSTAPEMIEILSEKLKATVDRSPRFDQTISGICENCEGYSGHLRNSNGRWICAECTI